MQLLPADRFPPVAARILAAQPEPPRRVSFSDLMEFSWPVLAYLPVPVLALEVLVLLTGMNRWYLVLFALLGVALVATWLSLQIWPLVLALRSGRADAGVIVDVGVLPRGGYRGHVRLEHAASTDPAEFYSLTLKTLKVGDGLKVLVNPANGKVVATLGAGKTT